MKTSDFDYELPEELIAQDPLENRSSSRLSDAPLNTFLVTVYSLCVRELTQFARYGPGVV